MQIVIDIPEEDYDRLKEYKKAPFHSLTSRAYEAIANGTLLPKGHGDLIDVNRKITVSTYDEQYEEWGEKTLTVLEALNKWSDEGVTVKDIVIPADKEYEVEVVTRGNCMICGKELTEGLFFCKECEDKASSRK